MTEHQAAAVDQAAGGELAEHQAAAIDQAAGGDPRVTHVGKATGELTPAEQHARRELARRVSARQPMITGTSFRRTAWFVR